MKVHNLMEDLIQSQVEDLFTNLKKTNSPWIQDGFENYMQDTICYVLNRVPPKYVVSGRGILHMHSNSDIDQLKADIDALAIEGIRLISVSRRRSYNPSDKDYTSASNPSYFFPTFIGTAFDGTTFEPLVDAKVTLCHNNEPVEMIDSTWINPCTTHNATNGVYSFWVKPKQAEKEGCNEEFNFTVNITATGYEPISYAFSVPVTSKLQQESGDCSVYSLKIRDLFLFPEGIENPME